MFDETKCTKNSFFHIQHNTQSKHCVKTNEKSVIVAFKPTNLIKKIEAKREKQQKPLTSFNCVDVDIHNKIKEKPNGKKKRFF